MAAFAALRQTVRLPTKPSSRATNLANRSFKSAKSGEPLSFHLAFILGNEFVLPEGNNSVDVLRLPFTHIANEGKPAKENPTGAILEFWTKKFNGASVFSHTTSEQDKMWQDRLLVVTEKRIFVVIEKTVKDGVEQQQELAGLDKEGGKRTSCNVCMEIVDSIPLEEITSVSLDSASDPGTWSCHEAKQSQSNMEPFDSERNLRRLLQLRPAAIAADGPCEPILRILTKPSKFNRGEPFHFLLPPQDLPCLDAEGGAAPLRARADAEALAGRLSALAARRRAEHARENRFRRLQKLLRAGWGLGLSPPPRCYTQRHNDNTLVCMLPCAVNHFRVRHFRARRAGGTFPPPRCYTWI
jgi:hypothetical protein